MKKIIFTVSLFLILFLLVAFKSQTVNSFPLFGKLIIIDVGHGSADPGSIYGSVYEKDYNLLFAKNLKKQLETLGASVLMTRECDNDLSNPNSGSRKRSDFNNRIKLINESGADLYISLHMNYLNDTKYFGSQSFFSPVYEQNEKLAIILQERFNKFFNFSKEPKKIDNDKYMYKRLEVKGVLIEFGFMSNYNDRKNLRQEDYRKQLAEVISDGIVEYFFE